MVLPKARVSVGLHSQNISQNKDGCSGAHIASRLMAQGPEKAGRRKDLKADSGTGTVRKICHCEMTHRPQALYSCRQEHSAKSVDVCDTQGH